MLKVLNMKHLNSIKFYNAIKKYGWDNFTHEVVYSNLNKQAADKLEKELIHKYNRICYYILVQRCGLQIQK